MSLRIPTLALRWAATLHGILLLPAMLAGSICLRAGEATTLELGVCACFEAPEHAGSSAAESLHSAECGPCHDVSVSAQAGPRAIASVGPPLLVQQIQAPPDAGPRGSTSGYLGHAGKSPGRAPTVLRC